MSQVQPSRRLLPALALACGMLAAAVGGRALQPHVLLAQERRIDLEQQVPRTFAHWRLVEEGNPQFVDAEVQHKLDQQYSQLLNRSYVDEQGYRIMLTLAYGNDQRRGLVAHRPDVCYPAQGFSVRPTEASDLTTPFGMIAAERMLAIRGERSEPVTFWFTLGERTVRNSLARRLVAFRYSLTGEIADGLLFRVSSIDPDPARGFAEQQRFVSELSQALSPEGRRRLAGLN